MNDNLRIERSLQTMSASQTSQSLPMLIQNGGRFSSHLSTTRFSSQNHHSKTSFWGRKSLSASFKMSSIAFILRWTILSRGMNPFIYLWVWISSLSTLNDSDNAFFKGLQPYQWKTFKYWWSRRCYYRKLPQNSRLWCGRGQDLVSMGETGWWAYFLQEADATSMPNWYKTQRLHCEPECTRHQFLIFSFEYYSHLETGRTAALSLYHRVGAKLSSIRKRCCWWAGSSYWPLFSYLSSGMLFVILSGSQPTESYRFCFTVRAGNLCLCQWSTKRCAGIFW